MQFNPFLFERHPVVFRHVPNEANEIERFRAAVGEGGIAARRSEQAVRQLSAEIEEELKAALGRAGLGNRLAALEQEVSAGRLTARAAARAIVAELLDPAAPGARKP